MNTYRVAVHNSDLPGMASECLIHADSAEMFKLVSIMNIPAWQKQWQVNVEEIVVADEPIAVEP